MNRGFRVFGAAAAAAVALIAGTGSAYADTTFDTGMVTVMAQTRAIQVGVAGITVVSLDKVSDPGVQVRVTTGDGAMPVVSTVHAAGENGCSAVDDPAHGTLNRTVFVQGGAWANVYVKVQYTTTTVLGISTTHVVQPFGPAGLTVPPLTLVTGVPVDVCMA
jgi:hypothetical protein